MSYLLRKCDICVPLANPSPETTQYTALKYVVTVCGIRATSPISYVVFSFQILHNRCDIYALLAAPNPL